MSKYNQNFQLCPGRGTRFLQGVHSHGISGEFFRRFSKVKSERIKIFFVNRIEINFV